jgi:aminoglycoside phosphotransferase (APT) family kinase protein
VSIGVLDLDDLSRRLNSHLQATSADARIDEVSELPGGLSGITYVVKYTSGQLPQKMVAKVATPGVAATKNRDVLRQASIIAALNEVGEVPTPRVLFTDAGSPPEVPPLFAMEFVDGENLEPLEERGDGQPGSGPSPQVLRGRYLHAADVLGRLHSTNIASLRTDEGAEGLEAELSKWRTMFKHVPPDLRYDADSCGELLQSAIPRSGPTSLVHGDYRLGNTLCRANEVLAVIDWEIWSLGDPRCDLGWFLHACDPDAAVARPGVQGVPSRADLIERYLAAGGPAAADLGWFDALALFKRAAASALIVKHNRRSAAPDPLREAVANTIPALLESIKSRIHAP